MTCPKCNTKVIEGYGFCGNCWFDFLSVPKQPERKEDPKPAQPPESPPQAAPPLKQTPERPSKPAQPLPPRPKPAKPLQQSEFSKPVPPQPARPPLPRPLQQPQPTAVKPPHEMRPKPKNRVLLYIVLGVVFLGFGIMAFSAPVANGDANGDIIGDWQCRDATQTHIWMCTLSFSADGRFIDRDGDQGYFRINGNSLTLDFDDYASVTVNFQLRGDRLTLTGPNLRIVLERV